MEQDDEYTDFEYCLELEFGDLIKTDDLFCAELWSAMTNTDWVHDTGITAVTFFGISFRVAGGIIASIRGCGDYMDWYCSGPSGVVSERVSIGLSKYGWSHNS